jgi:hypothetical protein
MESLLQMTLLPVVASAGPMVYGCMYCARSYHDTLATLEFAGLHSYLFLMTCPFSIIYSLRFENIWQQVFRNGGTTSFNLVC